VGSRLLVIFAVALDPSDPDPVVVRGSSVSYTAAAVGRAPGSFTSIEDTSVSSSAGTSARRARHKKGNKYLAAVTGETAVAAGKTATREGARYRKLARSRGKGKAQVAVGNTQLRVYHKLLSNPGMRYQDLGPDYYQRQAALRRKIAYHVREIEALGLEVTLARIPEPDPDGSASTQAA